MKKWIALLVAISLTLGMCMPVFAASSDPDTPVESSTSDMQTSCTYPIIFITGIGQTWTHLIDENGNYKYNDRRKLTEFNFFYRANKAYKLIEYNLFYADSNALKDPKVAFALLRIMVQIAGSAVLDRDLVSQQDLETVISAVMNRNIMDADGNLPSDVEDCMKPYPLSEYSEIDRDNFYFSIPCEPLVEQIGEENIYCFYHSAFDYFSRNADDLNTFIRDVVLGDTYNINHATQVVLIPMSMGAGVVNAYLDRYGAQNDVKKVISIVGAWEGADFLADLIEQQYSENAPELLYHSLLPTMIDDEGATGYIIAAALRLFRKAVLRDVIDTILAAVVQSVVLKAPSLVSMVPHDRYLAIEQNYLQGSEWDRIRAETRAYYDAQSSLYERLTALQAQGMEFYYLCGYGMHHGDADFAFLKFFASADDTNSDEILCIRSTAPGATYAPAGTSLEHTGKYVSPDGSIDLSTSFAPDRTWCFYGQKHQLEDNMTALHLALDIAVGKITDVTQSADLYPQFGTARDIGSVGGYMRRLTVYIEEHADDPALTNELCSAQDALQKCRDLQQNVTNTAEEDERTMAEVRAVLDILYPPEKESMTDRLTDRVSAWFTSLARNLHERSYEFFGAAGYKDKLFPH